MAYGYGYAPGGYYPQPGMPGYMQPGAPVPDQLAQLRAQQQYQPIVQTAAPQPAQQTGSGIIWVQGEAGAKSYMVAPGNSVLLMDSENQVFYLKGADASGMPLPLRIFDYTERAQPQPGGAAAPPAQQAAPAQDYVTRAEFDALAARLDALSAPQKPRRQSAKNEKEEGNPDAESAV